MSLVGELCRRKKSSLLLALPHIRDDTSYMGCLCCMVSTITWYNAILMTVNYRSSLQTASGFLSWLKLNILTFPCLLIVVISSVICSMLLAFHSFLILSGNTTWEMASRFTITYLKDLDPPINPFDEGCVLNAVHVFCCPGQDWDNIYHSKVIHKTLQ